LDTELLSQALVERVGPAAAEGTEMPVISTVE
jgi:hypothetical protein